MNRRRIILFGGTFDPVHVGHTAAALSSLERIGAHQLIFIPAKRSPLKSIFPEASDSDRLAMLKLATAENKNFDTGDYELNKKSPSFTLETVRHYRGISGKTADIYWLMGADALDDLEHWFGISELIDECNLSVMHRGGYPPPDFSRFAKAWGQRRIEKLERNVVETPLIEISSTDIRKRLESGQDVSGMVCPGVLGYISEHGLYGCR